MRIRREEALLLVIDIQYRLFPHIFEYEQIDLNCIRLIRGMKELNIPIHITEQYVKGLGPTIPTIEETLLDDYKPVEKMTFSCVDCEDYFHKLEASGKKDIIICGIETHVCVLQTAIDLIAKGYNVYVIENCVGSRNPLDKSIAIERMRQEGVRISSYESILFELCRTSGSAEFKAISAIVK